MNRYDPTKSIADTFLSCPNPLTYNLNSNRRLHLKANYHQFSNVKSQNKLFNNKNYIETNSNLMRKNFNQIYKKKYFKSKFHFIKSDYKKINGTNRTEINSSIRNITSLGAYAHNNYKMEIEETPSTNQIITTNNKRALINSNSSDQISQEDNNGEIKRQRLNLSSENLSSQLSSNPNSSSILKNSIQQLYEIKQIQPIKFEMLSSEGPAHKPMFRFSVKIKLNEKELNFTGLGTSKKNAKSISAMRVLTFLCSLPSFFSNFNQEYIKSIVSFDLKSLNMIDETFNSYLDKEKLTNEFVSAYEIVNEVIVKQETNDSSYDLIIDESKLSQLASQQTNPNSQISSTIEQSKTLLFEKINFDDKTKELIATRNVLAILNHLIPIGKYEFCLLDETGLSHAKVFKIELKVDRKFFNDSNSSSLTFYNKRLKECLNLTQLSSSESCLVFEDELCYKFIGFGNSKKSAKTRAAQLALETIYNIKLTTPEKEFVASDEELSKSTNNFKEFADNISEMVKNKHSSLVNSIEERLKKTTELISDGSTTTTTNSTSKTLIDDELTLTNQNKLRNVYAAIIQSNGFDFASSKIICITSGTKCINGEYMSQIGASLNDCHAEILAVRLLRKYFYDQLNKLTSALTQNNTLDSFNDDSNIFEPTFLSNNSNENIDEDNNRNSNNNKKPFQLKKNINFHLFISSAPCGDGRIFAIHDKIIDDGLNPSRKVHGLLRAKLESGEGTVPVGNTIKMQTWDGILIGERLKVMSCSDKLCKYNVVGLQGALLSKMIETIYFDSVIIGGFYHKSHLARALYGRLTKNLDDLPNGFRINKPILSSITNNQQRHVAKSSNKSLVWSPELNELFEIINCKEGKTIAGTTSSICKLELYKDWLRVLFNLKNIPNFVKSDLFNVKLEAIAVDTPAATAVGVQNDDYFNHYLKELTYNQAKINSIEYQLAKFKVYEAFRKANLGIWITKPFEQNYFTANNI